EPKETREQIDLCGISGVVSPNATFGAALDRVRVMMRALVHRGPDGDGIWEDPTLPLVLGHNRLAILDTSNAGAQPMLSSCGRYVITFNGEIYNFQTLRNTIDRVSEKSVAWRGHSDTE